MNVELNDDQRKIAMRALQKARQQGFALVEDRMSISTALFWWQRLLNFSMKCLGAQREPFKDAYNFRDITVQPVEEVACLKGLDGVLDLLTPEPVCSTCGGKHLAADPAGYYWDAEDWRGAPLLCLDCTD
jgi:hypothetical protein